MHSPCPQIMKGDDEAKDAHPLSNSTPPAANRTIYTMSSAVHFPVGGEGKGEGTLKI